MSTPEHLAGYEALSSAFKAATGVELVSYLVCGVDAKGEVYTGAKAPRGEQNALLIRAATQRLDFIKSQASLPTQN